MSLTNSFYQAVDSGDLILVRIMMKDSLLTDLSFKRYEEMKNASKPMEGLYQEYDGRDFILDKSKWDDNYMDREMVRVVNNFSHERLSHLKELVRYLRPYDEKEENKDSSKADNKLYGRKLSYEEQKRKDQQEGKYKGERIILGTVAGAAVGGVVASIVSTSVIGGIVVGGVAGGAIVTVIDGGGK